MLWSVTDNCPCLVNSSERIITTKVYGLIGVQSIQITIYAPWADAESFVRGSLTLMLFFFS